MADGIDFIGRASFEYVGDSHGANVDACALTPGFDTTPAFAAYLKRCAQDYRRWSQTPDQFEGLLT